MLLHAVENLGDHQLQPGNFLGDLHAGNPVVAGFDLLEVSSSGGDGLFRLLRKVFAAAEFFCLLSFSFFLLLALVIQVRKPPVTYSFKVLQPIEKRVGAKLVAEMMENVTTPEQYELLEMSRVSGFVNRAKGTGRPTKKDRRSLEEFTEPEFLDDFDFEFDFEEE